MPVRKKGFMEGFSDLPPPGTCLQAEPPGLGFGKDNCHGKTPAWTFL